MLIKFKKEFKKNLKEICVGGMKGFRSDLSNLNYFNNQRLLLDFKLEGEILERQGDELFISFQEISINEPFFYHINDIDIED